MITFYFSEDSIREKRDVDELEADTDTRKLFMEQGTLDEKMQKELAEYIDAKNKEVILWTKKLNFFQNFHRASESVQSMLDQQKEGQDAEIIKEKMAAVHSQVWKTKLFKMCFVPYIQTGTIFYTPY